MVQRKNKENFAATKKRSGFTVVYSFIHTFLAIFALFVAFKCNNGFKAMPFLFACCCPHLFLIYTAATTNFTFCLKNDTAGYEE